MSYKLGAATTAILLTVGACVVHAPAAGARDSEQSSIRSTASIASHGWTWLPMTTRHSILRAARPPKALSLADALARSARLPTVTGVCPTEGEERGRTVVTIHGTNLGDAIAVSFGWREAQLLAVQHPPSSVTVLSPPISDGAWEDVDITVTNTSGTSALNDAAHFHYTEAGEDGESLPFPGKLLNSLIDKALESVGLGPAGPGCAQR